MALSRTNVRLAQNAAQRKSQSVFLPAPLKGLNTVDAPGMMGAEYALSCVNFLPLENGLVTRGGTQPMSAAMPTDVTTVMGYTGGDGVLFGVSGEKIYQLPNEPNSSTAPVPVYFGLTSPWLQHVNFSNNGGSFLWACNGVDAPAYYDGTTWTAATITGVTGGAQPANVAVYQTRIFFCVPDSLDLYYLATDAIQGSASKLPLGSYFDRGGEILLIGNVTVDSGYGPDDYLVVVTSNGEAVTFKGRNPDNASTWAMVGRFQLARPMGKRSMVKWSGDLVIMTEAGVAGISSMLSQELAGLVNAATEKIQPTWAEYTRLGYGQDGWDICVYHRRGLMLLNIPTQFTGFKQYFFNPQTVAWSEVQGWEQIRCLTEFQGKLLAGMGRFVHWLDNLFNDVIYAPRGFSQWYTMEWYSGQWSIPEAIGIPIKAQVQQAFSFAGGQGVKKQYTLMRPYIMSSVQPFAAMGLNTDNIIQSWAVQQIMNYQNFGGSQWYSSEWYDMEWSMAQAMPSMRTRWVQAQALGYSASIILQLEADSASCTYTGSDLQFVVGNTL